MDKVVKIQAGSTPHPLHSRVFGVGVDFDL